MTHDPIQIPAELHKQIVQTQKWWQDMPADIHHKLVDAIYESISYSQDRLWDELGVALPEETRYVRFHLEDDGRLLVMLEDENAEGCSDEYGVELLPAEEV